MHEGGPHPESSLVLRMVFNINVNVAHVLWRSQDSHQSWWTVPDGGSGQFDEDRTAPHTQLTG